MILINHVIKAILFHTFQNNEIENNEIGMLAVIKDTSALPLKVAYLGLLMETLTRINRN